MVNDKDITDTDFEVTDDEHTEVDDTELVDDEASSGAKMKQLREKLKRSDEEKRQLLEATQRERADFLNARKRLEGERAMDKLRFTKKHIEALLPLCDSFEMAIKNKDAWEKADENWRKGIEGIHTQLIRLVESYGVTATGAEGEQFDPHNHEAIGTTPVTDKAQHDTVMTVLQRGYVIKTESGSEVIRPARVTTGKLSE